MRWRNLLLAPCRTHHTDPDGTPAYAERFDEVLKFHEPGLASVAKGGLAWHIYTDGSPAYADRHRRTFGYYEGRAAVVGDDGWHHITESGSDAYKERYSWCGNFQEQRCTIRESNGSYFHIDQDGWPIYRERWNYAGDFRDGIAVVQNTEGRSTHIDHHGRLFHDFWFNDLDVFHKGFARARDEDGWTHVDLDGRPIYKRRFAAVEPFYNGQARVEGFDGSLEIIDEQGQTHREIRPAQCSEFAQLSGDMVGFWRTQTISTAVQLGVPDALPASEATVAKRCGITPDGARRLLRALRELKLTANEAIGWYLTPRGEYLRRDHPLTLADAALEYAGPFSRMWKTLPQALSIDSDWTAPDVFAQVAADESRCAGHHRMLRSYARHDYPAIVGALDLKESDHVIDAGGGLGELATRLLDALPSLSVTVIERPEVIEMAECEASRPQIHWRQANLLEPWGVQADAVLLARVLHDWSDIEAVKILGQARQALSPGGRVFIIEMLLPEDGNAGALCDLHLLMATGGRERPASQYVQLLREAGFVPADIHSTSALPSIVAGVAP